MGRTFGKVKTFVRRKSILSIIAELLVVVIHVFLACSMGQEHKLTVWTLDSYLSGVMLRKVREERPTGVKNLGTEMTQESLASPVSCDEMILQISMERGLVEANLTNIWHGQTLMGSLHVSFEVLPPRKVYIANLATVLTSFFMTLSNMLLQVPRLGFEADLTEFLDFSSRT